MTLAKKILLPAIDLNCFACGSENSCGLKMRFETDGVKIYSSLEIPSHLRGWNNLVHGGVITAVLDEAMSWAAFCLTRSVVLTKKIEVEFLRPLLVEKKIFIEGWIEKKENERNAVMSARIHDEKNKNYAKGTGIFALFTKNHFTTLGITDDETMKGMDILFNAMADLKSGDN